MRWNRRSVLLVTLWSACIGLFFFSYRYLEYGSNRQWPDWRPHFINEMSAALAGYLLFWPLWWFTERFPVDRQHLWRNIGLHLLAMVGWSVSHTTMLAIIRPVFYQLWLQRSFDYGDMPIRYLMEFSIGVFVYWAQVGAISAFRFQRVLREREVRAAQLERELTQAHLDALRLQLRPHFLFNALNAVSSVMYEDPRKADRMIASLSEFLRAVLRQESTHTVPLREEIRLLDQYLSIMQVRFGERLQVEKSVPPALLDAMVPPLLLQPLVENCVQHGVDATSGVLTLEIRAEADDGCLRLSVRDRGPGLDAGTSRHQGPGIGLANCRRRLERLYGANQQLTLRNAAGGGAEAQVELPLAMDEAGVDAERAHAS